MVDIGIQRNLKTSLIEQGVIQLTLHGVEGFSLRETAKLCQVSCAAPFKHFKDKAQYFLELSVYLDGILLEVLMRNQVSYEEDIERLCQENSFAYVDYLISHPFLMNLSFWNDMGHERPMGIRDWKSLDFVIGNFKEYCKSLCILKEDYRKLLYMMQSLTYGTAYMATSGMLNQQEDYSIKLREAMEQMFRPYKTH